VVVARSPLASATAPSDEQSADAWCQVHVGGLQLVKQPLASWVHGKWRG
jgi:hypothetical protein